MLGQAKSEMFRLNFIQKKGKKNIFTLLEKKEEGNKEKHDRVYPAKSTDTSTVGTNKTL